MSPTVFEGPPTTIGPSRSAAGVALIVFLGLTVGVLFPSSALGSDVAQPRTEGDAPAFDPGSLLSESPGAPARPRVGQALFAPFDAGLRGVDRGSSAVHDVDGDGHLDLLITGYDAHGAASATLYWGDGTGGFTDAGAGLTGVTGGSASVADVNEDGHADLLVTGRDSSFTPSTTLYFGDGSGGFAEAGAGLLDVGGGFSGRSATSIADVDGDGHLDVLLTGSDASFLPTAALYLGDGTGGFTEKAAGLRGASSGSTSIADVNADGHLDILITGNDPNFDPAATLYLGDGTGSFSDARAGLVGVQFSSTSIADIDGDGRQDLIITGSDANGSPRTTVYLGDGEGAFAAADLGLTDVTNGSTSAGDLDGDGNLDLLLVGRDASFAYTAALYLGTSGGAFERAQAGLTGVYGGWAGIGDFNEDGKLDLLITGAILDGTRTATAYENLGIASHPRFVSRPLKRVLVERTYAYDVVASDPDGDTAALTLRAPTLPAWLSFTDEGSGQGILRGTPSDSDLEAHAVVLEVEDGDGNATEQSFEVEVTESFALRFDGANDVVKVSGAGELNLDSRERRTIEAWFRAGDETIANRRQVIYEEGGEADGFNLYVYDGALYAGAWSETNGWEGTWLQTTAIQPSYWHHVALVFDVAEGQMTGYLDGSSFGSASVPVSVSGHVGAVAVGAAHMGSKFAGAGGVSGNGHTFGGTLDEVRVWNRARSQPEIDAGRFGVLSGNEPDLVAYWPMDEGSGTGMTDATGGLHFGVISGARWVKVDLPATEGAPRFSSVPVAQVLAGKTYRYGVAAADPDGPDGSLSLQAPRLPIWLSFADEGSGRGLLTGTPSPGDTGTEPILLTVEDGDGNAGRQSFDVRVAENHGLQFDGADDYLTVNDSKDINEMVADRRTIEAWFRVEDKKVAGRRQIIYEEGGQKSGFNLYLYDGALYAGAWSEPTGWSGTWLKTTSVRSGIWHHVALAFDGEGGRLAAYLDGLAFGDEAAPPVVSAHAEDIGIGAVRNETKFQGTGGIAGDGHAFEGTIDEIRIWNSVRSQEEIEAHRSGVLPRYEPGLAAYWPLNEGIGTIGADATGGRQFAFLSGAQWTEVDYLEDREITLQITAKAAHVSSEMRFEWNHIGDDASYRLELARAPDAAAVFRTVDAGSATSVAVDATALDEGQAYYARVLGSTDAGASYPYRSGFTGGTVVDRTAPVADPPVGRLTEEAHVAFSATGRDNVRIDSFRVQISDDPSFAEVLTERTVAPDRSAEQIGSPGITYYARAIAVDAAGLESPYSTVSVGVPVPELPDLVASGVSAPSEAFSGQPIQVRWVVSNDGKAGTSAPTWRDAIYLSEDDAFDAAQDTKIGDVANVSFLAVGEPYGGEAEVTLPRGISGTRHVFVWADGKQQMAESSEENNASGSGLSIELSPYPDLEVTNLTVPQTAFSGDTVHVAWTVENKGTGPADLAEWTDAAFLSSDATFDFNFTQNQEKIRIQELLLGRGAHEGTLPAGASYSAAARVPLPVDSIGDYVLFIYADMPGGGKQLTTGDLYEYNQDLDNWRGDSLEIRLTPPPDLAVTRVKGPAEATSGEEVVVSWTVENQGAGDTPRRSTSWNDAIYYSESPTFDAGAAELLRMTRREGALPRGESYAKTGVVTVPDGAEGDGYFFVHTDWDEDIFEHTFEVNNRAAEESPTSVSLAPYPDLQATGVRLSESSGTAGERIEVRYTLRNRGTAQAAAWRDSIYVSSSSTWQPGEARRIGAADQAGPLASGTSGEFAGAARLPADLSAGEYYLYVRADGGGRAFEHPDTTGNVARSSVLTIDAYPPVDLSVSTEDVPGTLPSGSSFAPTVTVTNVGAGRTLAREWTDGTYLSLDATLDDGDLELGTRAHETPLDGSASYSLRPPVEIPNEVSGSYYLLFATDVDGETADANRADNAAARAVSIEQPPPADLTVRAVNVPQAAASGQPLTVSWTTENTGTGPTRDSTWFDVVYLSRDPSVSRGDVRLGRRLHGGVLAAGGTYADSIAVDVPLFASGQYYVLVETDARDDVFELAAEANNVGPAATSFTLPAPGDLQVEGVDVPASATAGDSVTVRWTLRNGGPNAVRGRLREGVFVSSDSTWDIGDPLLGTIERTVELDSAETTEAKATVNLAKAYATAPDGTVTRRLPGVQPGDYYILVRTDLGNAIRETNDDNNAARSPGTLAASMPSLSIGDSEPVSLASDEGRYYQVEVPKSAEDVAFTLSGGPDGGSLQLYVRRGEVPSQIDFDARADAPFETSQTVTLTGTAPGTYYLLARAESLPSGPAPLALAARRLTFEIRDWSPQAGGNGGVVTVQVEGAKFEEGAALFLEAPGGSRHSAQSTVVGQSTKLKARFNLRGLPAGPYDLVVRNPDRTEVRAPGGFKVESSEGADPYVTTRYPSNIRGGAGFEIEVTVGNRGNENAVDLFLLLGARGYEARPQPRVIAVSSKRAKSQHEEGERPLPLTVTDTYPHEDLDLDVDLTVSDSTSQGVRVDQETVIYPFWFYEIPPDQTLTFRLKIEHDIPQGFVLHEGRFVEMPDSKFKRTASPEDLDTSAGIQLLAGAMGETVRRLNDSMEKETVTADQAEDGLRDMVADQANSVSPLGKGAIVGAGVGFVVGAGLCYASVICGASVTLTGVIAAGFGVGSLGGFMGSIYDAMKGSEAAVESGEGLIDRTFDGLDGERTNVRKSKDPNDILGPDGHGEQNWVAADRPLGYTIRFENDPKRATATAQVVVIRHPLDADVDERSFEIGPFGFANQTFEVPANRASYSVRLDAVDSLGVFVDLVAGIDVEAREAFWRFTSIDPATGSQPTADPFAGVLPVNDSTGIGEGFVKYHVRPAPHVQTGAEIEAQAEIVFDRNAPIETPAILNTVDADAPESELALVPRSSADNAFRVSWQRQDVGAGVGGVQLYVAEGDSGSFAPYGGSVQDTSIVFVGEKNRTYRFYTRASDFVGNEEPAKRASDSTRTLPVELSGLTARLEGEAVTLRWTTASETGNAGFEVERAVGDGAFGQIGFVQGRGTSASPTRYRFRDESLPFEAETLTYRLHQIDEDGSGERSGPVVVERAAPGRFALHPNYPNPAANRTTVPYEVAKSGEVRMRLYDVLGRRVMEAPLGPKGPGRYLHSLDVSRLSSGVYFVVLQVEGKARTLFRTVEKLTLVK